jgi:hypothetical protein
MNVRLYIQGMGKKPLQVYLDERDRKLLEDFAEREGLSLAEALRVSLRRSAAAAGLDDDPLLKLIGIIDDPDGPTDWSTNHDKYLAELLERESHREQP